MGSLNWNFGHSLRGLSKPNALRQLVRSHCLQCPLHGIEDGSFPQPRAFEFGLVFWVNFEGDLMPSGESPMDPRYRNTHLKLLGIDFLSFLDI